MSDPIRMQPTADTLRTLARMKRVDILKPLKREISQATARAVTEIKAEIRSKPSNTGHSAKDSLRNTLAKAVRRTVRISSKRVSVMVYSKGSGYANLARAVDGEIPWQHQGYTEPAMPYFTSTMQRVLATLSARIDAAVQRALAKL